jgi:hypothetical protein
MTGSFTAVATGVENVRTSSQPSAFRLEQNFPNPFNPSTIISFDLPVRAFVSVKVYDAIGQEVATLANGNMEAGSHSTVWNAASMPSGIYFCRLQASGLTQTRKLVLLR